jgi:predicted DNA-binding transcriptional regulator YafY
MNRIDRLFGILTLLQSRKYISAEKIAEKFKISVRTVFRDLKALSESGIPLSFEPAKGYFIVQGYFLPPISLTNDEANSLLLMESMVYGFTDKSIQKHYTNALNKIKSILPTSQKEKVEFLTNNIKYQVPARLKQDYEHLSILQKTIASKNIISFSYKNNKEEISRRKAEPIGLVFYAFGWHLIAWCHTRQEYRDFNVSRMFEIEDTHQLFLKSDHIEVSEYMPKLPVNY